MLALWTTFKALAAAASLLTVVGPAPTAPGAKALRLSAAPLDGRTIDGPADRPQRQRERRALREQEERERRTVSERKERERAHLSRGRELEERAQRRHNLEAELREIMERARELRLHQVALQAELERAEIDQEGGKAQDFRRELVDVEHQLRITEIEAQRLMEAREQDNERRNILTMTDRLGFVERWEEVAFHGPRAVMMATQAIVELHLANGDVRGATERLEELLGQVDGVGSRTAIRFALKDLYSELGKPKRAAEHMFKVILENAGRDHDE